ASPDSGTSASAGAAPMADASPSCTRRAVSLNRSRPAAACRGAIEPNLCPLDTTEVHPMKPLQGRIALVTGGSRGIGRATGIALGRAGAAVAVTCRSNLEAAENVCAAITQMGQRAVACQADVSREEDAHHMVERVRQEL